MSSVKPNKPSSFAFAGTSTIGWIWMVGDTARTVFFGSGFGNIGCLLGSGFKLSVFGPFNSLIVRTAHHALKSFQTDQKSVNRLHELAPIFSDLVLRYSRCWLLYTIIQLLSTWLVTTATECNYVQSYECFKVLIKRWVTFRPLQSSDSTVPRQLLQTTTTITVLLGSLATNQQNIRTAQMALLHRAVITSRNKKNLKNGNSKYLKLLLLASHNNEKTLSLSEIVNPKRKACCKDGKS